MLVSHLKNLITLGTTIELDSVEGEVLGVEKGLHKELDIGRGSFLLQAVESIDVVSGALKDLIANVWGCSGSL